MASLTIDQFVAKLDNAVSEENKIRTEIEDTEKKLTRLVMERSKILADIISYQASYIHALKNQAPTPAASTSPSKTSIISREENVSQ